ncbi:MAG: ribonuclease HII [Saprospiraceae bacterium]|nr:ribonuclease HII [Saprospiraceae bacterium]
MAGPVFAAAVMLDPEKPIKGINDSKKLNAPTRLALASEIKEKAVCWSVIQVSADVIDATNILRASLKAMAEAVHKLDKEPSCVLVDGHIKLPDLPYEQYCFVKGDGKYQSIAAASILAKTSRDLYMEEIHTEFPEYLWNQNKGYPTIAHRIAIEQFGLCKYHRKTFQFKIHENPKH